MRYNNISLIHYFNSRIFLFTLFFFFVYQLPLKAQEGRTDIVTKQIYVLYDVSGSMLVDRDSFALKSLKVIFEESRFYKGKCNITVIPFGDGSTSISIDTLISSQPVTLNNGTIVRFNRPNSQYSDFDGAMKKLDELIPTGQMNNVVFLITDGRLKMNADIFPRIDSTVYKSSLAADTTQLKSKNAWPFYTIHIRAYKESVIIPLITTTDPYNYIWLPIDNPLTRFDTMQPSLGISRHELVRQFVDGVLQPVDNGGDPKIIIANEHFFNPESKNKDSANPLPPAPEFSKMSFNKNEEFVARTGEILIPEIIAHYAYKSIDATYSNNATVQDTQYVQGVKYVEKVNQHIAKIFSSNDSAESMKVKRNGYSNSFFYTPQGSSSKASFRSGEISVEEGTAQISRSTDATNSKIDIDRFQLIGGAAFYRSNEAGWGSVQTVSLNVSLGKAISNPMSVILAAKQLNLDPGSIANTSMFIQRMDSLIFKQSIFSLALGSDKNKIDSQIDKLNGQINTMTDTGLKKTLGQIKTHLGSLESQNKSVFDKIDSVINEIDSYGSMSVGTIINKIGSNSKLPEFMAVMLVSFYMDNVPNSLRGIDSLFESYERMLKTEAKKYNTRADKFRLLSALLLQDISKKYKDTVNLVERMKSCKEMVIKNLYDNYFDLMDKTIGDLLFSLTTYDKMQNYLTKIVTKNPWLDYFSISVSRPFDFQRTQSKAFAFGFSFEPTWIHFKNTSKYNRIYRPCPVSIGFAAYFPTGNIGYSYFTCSIQFNTFLFDLISGDLRKPADLPRSFGDNNKLVKFN